MNAVQINNTKYFSNAERKGEREGDLRIVCLFFLVSDYSEQIIFP